MIEQVTELNRNMQIGMFVIYILCAAGDVLMGWHIYTMDKNASQNKKAVKLFLAVAVWTAGFALVGVSKEADIAENLVHMSMVGSAMWLAWCPEYLMQSAFFSGVGKKYKYLYYFVYAAAVVYIISLMMRHESGRFVIVSHGVAYVSRMHGLMKSYFAALAGMLLLLGMLLLPIWKTKTLKRERRVVYLLTAAYGLLIVVTIADFVLPMLGIIIFPLGTLAATIFLAVLYRARKTVDRMNITTEVVSRHIYELVPIPLMIVRNDHTIVEVNQFSERFFEKEAEEMKGRALEDFVGNAFFSLKNRFEKEVSQKKENYEVSVTCHHNKNVCGLKYNIIYDNYGEFSYAVLQFTDMSKHYAMFHKLEESRNLAETANAAKTQFLANMSHEIRTPLNVILGMNEMILRETGEAFVAEYADNIKNAAESMVYMVNDILDMSKMESDKLEIIHTEYDIKSMLKSIVKAAGLKAKAKNIRLICDIDPELYVYLIGDENRIGQIISKFLNNAVKYTLSGTIVLRIQGERKAANSINLHIAVEDMGIGIRKEDIGKLFDVFSRVNLRENRTLSGLGLGLAIIKKTAEAMGGSVAVQSEYGKGSVFSATIPQRFEKTETVGDFNRWLGAFEAHTKDKKAKKIYAPDAHILAVDDTNVNLEVVKALLKRTKIQIDTALSGAACLEMAAKKQYHMILMDHMMPEMDGIETLHALKRLENNLSKDAVVIALTANAVSGAREFYLEQGFDDYLKKPVKSAELEKMLAAYLPWELLESHKAEKQLLNDAEWADSVHFDCIDVKKGLVYTDNNPVLFQDIMKQFLQTGREQLYKTEQAYEQENWGDYERLVHTLKSASNGIGAEKLASHAKLLENAVKKEKMDYIRVNHRTAMDLYKTVLEELQDYFTQAGKDAKKDKTVCTELTKEQFSDRMLLLMDRLDTAITTDIEKVTAQMKLFSYKGIELTEGYKEIFTLIEEYEYEKAMLLVEEVIKSDV